MALPNALSDAEIEVIVSELLSDAAFDDVLAGLDESGLLALKEFEITDAAEIVRSQRRWGSQLVTGVLKHSAARLNELLGTAIEDGLDRQQIIARLQSDFDESIMPQWRAQLIAQTEYTRASNNARRNGFSRLGRAEIQWLDGQPAACASCKGLHRQSIPMMVDGEPNMFHDPIRGIEVFHPPLHPGCRCATTALEGEDIVDSLPAPMAFMAVGQPRAAATTFSERSAMNDIRVGITALTAKLMARILKVWAE